VNLYSLFHYHIGILSNYHISQTNPYNMTNKIRARYLWIAAFLIFGTACKKNTVDSTEEGKDKSKVNAAVDVQQEMRTFIKDISAYARQYAPNFMIVPQDGLALLTSTGDSTGTPDTSYLNAINGVGQEEVYYGYDNVDDATTPTSARNAYLRMLRLAQRNG
jgi:cysteinyl-tRNA synthetase, unknown class